MIIHFNQFSIDEDIIERNVVIIIVMMGYSQVDF